VEREWPEIKQKMEYASARYISGSDTQEPSTKTTLEDQENDRQRDSTLLLEIGLIK
jgi:hypothetical protein